MSLPARGLPIGCERTRAYCAAAQRGMPSERGRVRRVDDRSRIRPSPVIGLYLQVIGSSSPGRGKGLGGKVLIAEDDLMIAICPKILVIGYEVSAFAPNTVAICQARSAAQA